MRVNYDRVGTQLSDHHIEYCEIIVTQSRDQHNFIKDDFINIQKIIDIHNFLQFISYKEHRNLTV